MHAPLLFIPHGHGHVLIAAVGFSQLSPSTSGQMAYCFKPSGLIVPYIGTLALATLAANPPCLNYLSGLVNIQQ
jgi:hypothetical protein